MSAPYARTVLTGNAGGPAGNAIRAAGDAIGPAGEAIGPAGSVARPVIGGRQPILLAGLGAACISASAVLVTLADTGTATVAFYRCLLAVPVLAILAVAERKRHGQRRLAQHLGAALAGVSLPVDRGRG